MEISTIRDSHYQKINKICSDLHRAYNPIGGHQIRHKLIVKLL